MRIRITVLIIAAILMLLGGCSGAGDEEAKQTGADSGNDISAEYSSDEVVLMDASEKYLNSECDTSVLDEMENSIKTESGAYYESIKALLSDADIYAAVTDEKWTESCFVSDVVIPSYDMRTNNLSENYTVLAFSSDLENVIEITVRSSDKGVSLSVSDFSMTMRQIFRENRDEKYIFIKNAGFLALDSANGVYVIDRLAGNSYEIQGDFYHTVDYRALSVSYNEIMAQEHLHEIKIGR